MERDEWASSLWEEALRDTPEARREAARLAEESARARSEAARRAAEEEHAAGLARARARQLEIEAEALERRNAAARERAERRRSRAASKRKTQSNKDDVNDYLHKIGKSFHLNPNDMLTEAFELLERSGFAQVGEPRVDAKGNSSRQVYSVEDADGTLYAFVWSTYRMPTGRYEITAYLS